MNTPEVVTVKLADLYQKCVNAAKQIEAILANLALDAEQARSRDIAARKTKLESGWFFQFVNFIFPGTLTITTEKALATRDWTDEYSFDRMNEKAEAYMSNTLELCENIMLYTISQQFDNLSEATFTLELKKYAKIIKLNTEYAKI